MLNLKKLGVSSLSVALLATTGTYVMANNGDYESIELGNSSSSVVIIQLDEEYPGQLDQLELAPGVRVRSTPNISASVQASRPWAGGNLTGTARTEANFILQMIGARVRINNNGANIETGSWNRLNNTHLVTATLTGTGGRVGAVHGDHEWRTTASGTVQSTTTTDTRFQ
ncbi:MAG: hypothetical protein FWF57_02950 [Defluviitaleaceae bacterium]|nr:hypothetical protein [Defluviitaleaceae bacterium]